MVHFQSLFRFERLLTREQQDQNTWVFFRRKHMPANVKRQSSNFQNENFHMKSLSNQERIFLKYSHYLGEKQIKNLANYVKWFL